MNRAKIVAFLLVICIWTNTNAQLRTIKGFISDSGSLNPIIKVSILNQTQQKRYISNHFGAFSIPANPGDTLLLSCLGYQSQTIVYGTKTSIPDKSMVCCEVITLFAVHE